MKALDLYMLLFASLPIMASAQTSDDLYYTPKKKTQVQQRTTVVQQSANPAISEVRITPDHVTVIKGDKASDTVPPVNMESIIEDIDDNTVEYTNESEGWVNGFDGSESDYEYARRLLSVRSLKVGIPVGSTLYWDLIHGPYAYDWNVYVVGGYAYIFPTWANPIYHDFLTHGYNWYCFGWGWGMSYWRRGWYFHDWYHNYYHPHFGHHPHNYTAMAPHVSYRGHMVSHGRTPRVAGQRVGNGRLSYSRGRVVQGSSTRNGAYSRPGSMRGGESHYSRSSASSSRPSSSTYTRPSSTRRTVESGSVSTGNRPSYYRGGNSSSERSTNTSSRSSYDRGSSSMPSSTRSSSGGGYSSGGGSHSGGGHGASGRGGHR